MVKKVFLLLNTVRYLKPLQCFYQIKYRLLPKQTVSPLLAENISICAGIQFDDFINGKRKYLGNNTFQFLNLTKQFYDQIDWDFMEFGKLWNYNLEYFDFLTQMDISNEEKKRLIYDFYEFSSVNKRAFEPYPISLRAINIIRFTIQNEVYKERYLEYLFKELRFLSNRYELHILGNHLLENGFAMCLGGAFFKQSHWHKKAVKLLNRQLEEQILPDGAHFELSPMYHKIIFYRLLELIDWYNSYKNKEEKFVFFLRKKAAKMRSWLEQIQFVNGDIPLFNDAAKGIAYSNIELLKYADRLHIASARLPLSESGYRSYKGANYEVKVDFAQTGAFYQPGHVHADALSFILYYKNVPLFVEQGTSTYNIGERRNLERSTEAHNTVVCCNKNQSTVWGGFRVGKRAVTTITSDESTKIQAFHSGYESYGIRHTRTFRFFPREVEITDNLGDGIGVFYLHLHPDRGDVTLDSRELIVIDQNKVQIALHGSEEVKTEVYQFAESYNLYRSSKRLVIHFKKKLTVKFNFL